MQTCDVGSDFISLDKLRNIGKSEESLSELRRFHRQLKYHGYIVLRHEDPELQKLLDDLYSLSRVFFAQRPSFKSGFHTHVTDNGYTLKSGVKESLMVRLAEGNKFPFDVDSMNEITEEERAIAKRVEAALLQYYGRMKEITKICLAAIAHFLGIPPQKLWQILEPEVIPRGEYSTATVRMFHYFNLEGGDEPCYDHNDLGFLTLIPCTAVPGLQMAKFCSKCPEVWVDVEKHASHTKHDIFVFAGETMTHLLNGYLVASLHRVTSNPEHIDRFSLPFLVKGWPDAVLDSNALGCEHLIGRSPLPPQTVNQFMNAEQARRESVNNLY